MYLDNEKIIKNECTWLYNCKYEVKVITFRQQIELTKSIIAKKRWRLLFCKTSDAILMVVNARCGVATFRNLAHKLNKYGAGNATFGRADHVPLLVLWRGTRRQGYAVPRQVQQRRRLGGAGRRQRFDALSRHAPR